MQSTENLSLTNLNHWFPQIELPPMKRVNIPRHWTGVIVVNLKTIRNQVSAILGKTKNDMSVRRKEKIFRHHLF